VPDPIADVQADQPPRMQMQYHCMMQPNGKENSR
jgi:hypothetical protein